MNKIHIVGKNPEKIKNLKEILLKNNFVYSEENPDLVIACGGDGTFLIAERRFPGVPKILLKDSHSCQKCCDLDIETVINLYNNKKYNIQEIKKLKAIHEAFETRELIAVNDIVIRNTLPTEAIRFKLKVNEKEVGEFIGDGLVISTAYGSHGYFSSITRENFENGIGIAFNNTTVHHNFILIDSGKIEIEIIRGPGVLVSDNNRDFIDLEKGDKIIIKEIEDIAKKIILK